MFKIWAVYDSKTHFVNYGYAMGYFVDQDEAFELKEYLNKMHGDENRFYMCPWWVKGKVPTEAK